MAFTSKFRLHIAPVKPGDFGLSGLAVYNEACDSVVVEDGAVIEALGPLMTDHGEGEDYRKVRTSDGFEGNVIWWPFDRRSGFEAV